MSSYGSFPVGSEHLKGGHILKWHVVEGSQIQEDQLLADINVPSQYSKAFVRSQLRAPISGTIKQLAAVLPTANGSANGASSSASGAGASSAATCVAVIDYCTHGVLFGSLCSVCAMDVTSLPPRTKQLWQQSHAASGRAGNKRKRPEAEAVSAPGSSTSSSTGGKIHWPAAQNAAGGMPKLANGAAPTGLTSYRVAGHKSGYELTVSDSHAEETDAAIRARLHASKKLVLVLDLDHTLIHATHDERAAGVHDARVAAGDNDTFTFDDGFWRYFIKTRPGLRTFLETANQYFELHVDTAGTRAYARSVLAFIDPEGKLFGSRVVSRCDSSMRHKEATSWLHRSLRDSSMTLIVDDTRAVWKGALELLQIEPYAFWQGGPDAEANNLAGRSVTDTGTARMPPPPPALPALPALTAASGLTPTAAASTDAAASPASTDSNSSGRDEIDGAQSTSTADTAGAASSAPTLQQPQAHPIVCKEEAHPYLLDILRVILEVHKKYYEAYDAAQASGVQDCLRTTAELLDGVQRTILDGTCLVFSGVFPTDMPIAEQRTKPLYERCVAFGAAVSEAVEGPQALAPFFVMPTHVEAQRVKDILQEGASVHALRQAQESLSQLDRRCVTHVVARTAGTAKTRQAQSAGDVRVVALRWLEECLKRYERQPEEDYPLAEFETCTLVPQKERVARLQALKQACVEERAQQVALTRAQYDGQPALSGDGGMAGEGAAEDEVHAHDTSRDKQDHNPHEFPAHTDSDANGGQRGARRGQGGSGLARSHSDRASTGSASGHSEGNSFADELEGMFTSADGHEEEDGYGMDEGGEHEEEEQ